MDRSELYPELIDYIYEYCGRYLWKNEALVSKYFFALSKSNNGANTVVYKFLMREDAERNLESEFKELIKDGYEAYRVKVVERIWSEHRYELGLNLCPECGKIARTPWAKQCRFCYHDWH